MIESTRPQQSEDVIYILRDEERTTVHVPIEEIASIGDDALRGSLEAQHRDNVEGNSSLHVPIAYEDGTHSHTWSVRRLPLELLDSSE